MYMHLSQKSITKKISKKSEKQAQRALTCGDKETACFALSGDVVVPWPRALRVAAARRDGDARNHRLLVNLNNRLQPANATHCTCMSAYKNYDDAKSATACMYIHVHVQAYMQLSVRVTQCTVESRKTA